MEYLEFTFKINATEEREILIAELNKQGFDGFVEESDFFMAYIPSEIYNKETLAQLIKLHSPNTSITYDHKIIKEKNWNEEWEKNYPSVLIAGKCLIRAPFHKPVENILYDIIIEPKMSFGTAHHETTSLMIETIMETDMKGLNVLDMGCGTGVLAILASKLGAKQVTAIDNDEWSFINAKENTERNAANNVNVLLGDAELLNEKTFNVILANINRNVLTKDIPNYASCLNTNGILIVSGFYEDDIKIISEHADLSGLFYSRHELKNNWAVIVFKKIEIA